MAKQGKKLELYEILAAKRGKGKQPLAFEPRSLRPPGKPGPEPAAADRIGTAPALIIDEGVLPELPNAVSGEGWKKAGPEVKTAPGEIHFFSPPQRPAYPAAVAAEAVSEPKAPPRPRSPREVVLALDMAFFCSLAFLGMAVCSYFIGYRRGQEERPASLVGGDDIFYADPNRLSPRRLAPAPRAVVSPGEQDYTLIIRTEAVDGELPERLELELAEAVAKGKLGGGDEVQGFIFKTGGTDPRFVLSVGLGKSANDPRLDKLLKIYYQMDGLTFSRETTPYRGCRVAPVRELGVQVY
ncbi:MAG: hypothetical protein LBU64_08665 [Planctomycetota bacterium]|nr:hypothetical protein [Planctomycetota bacterium]